MISKSTSRVIRAVLISAAIFLTGAVSLPASTLFVGFNTQTPVQLYATGGTYMQDFGPAGAIAAASYGTGDYLAVTPSTSSSVVTEYNNSLAQIGSFSIGNLLTDAGVQGSDLLFSAYDGTIYRTSQSGSVLNSWSTGYSHVGVTSNGTDIFTTEGDSGNLIDIWSGTGAKLGTITTPFNGLYGLGYDAATGDFWAGSTNFVYQLSGTGSLIASYDLSGDSRTPNGAVHDGLEVGNFGVTPPPPTVPEPASIFLLVAGLAGLGLLRVKSARKHLARTAGLLGAAALTCFGSVSVTLTPSVSSGVPVGTPVTWTATAKDSASATATFTYEFSEAPSGTALAVKKDWYNSNTFPWTPSDSEGTYDIQVNVRSSTGATGSTSATFNVSSRISGSNPVVTATKHPLIALYSVPPCTAGHTARVRFKLPSDTVWQATSFKTCTGSKSLNFYVAGMRGNSTYQLQQDVYNGPFDTVGPVLTFKTGSVPSGITTPYTVVKAPTAPNNTVYPLTFTADTGGVPYAIDSLGQMVWYLQATGSSIFTHVLPGGTFYEIASDAAKRPSSLLREYDLAGNILWETNYAAISQRLVAMGDDPITSVHHEAVRLPNGWIALFGSSERVANQGKGLVDVLGDQVVVVDSSFNVKWYWNEFDHLDIMRPAVLGEVCVSGQAGCPPVTNPHYTVANDWTHSNAIYPTPDGNLLVSSRHQDWVFKILYSNGTGDGAILWRFGKDGDFTTTSSDPYPWPSHQHDTQINPNGLMTLFDNGNTRIADLGSGHSRGQAWSLNESSKVATLVTNLDLGVFSEATGSTQLLSNGNYFFDLGFINAANAELKEYTTSDVIEQQIDIPHTSYRTFRLRTLYSGEQ